MKRRGFLGALLAAPLALVGIKKAPALMFRRDYAAMAFTAKAKRLRVFTVASDVTGLLKKGDKFTVAGLYE